MAITAKELAEKLNISAAAVSMALNDKPGVSTKTRKMVKLAAEKYGYDFTRINAKAGKGGTIYFINYRKSGAIVSDTPFFSEMTDGIKEACSQAGYKLRVISLYEADLAEEDLSRLIPSECDGILLLGTEMMSDDIKPFQGLFVPLVVLDSYFETFACDTILINNEQGAYQAARHLIRKRKSQPGYLMSSVRINNFQSRADGFFKAVRASGMSSTQCIVHELTPSYSGAYADMKQILERKEPLADCYFADNDLIAAGAVRAFKEAGMRIPEDVAVVGFDNMPVAQVLDPALTTINVPKKYIGQQAVLRLVQRIASPDMPVIKEEIATTLIDRYSC